MKSRTVRNGLKRDGVKFTNIRSRDTRSFSSDENIYRVTLRLLHPAQRISIDFGSSFGGESKVGCN